MFDALLQTLSDSIEQQRDPYKVANEEMNKQLQKQNLPSMEKLLSIAKEHSPELFL